MIAQRHRIRRQVIEVRVPESGAGEIQNELSYIQRSYLERIIDECCSELSSPDCIHRIDKLEVDLGNVSLRSLEIQLPQALKSALRKALEIRIAKIDRDAQSAGQHTAVKSQLELLAFFASSGTVPWWADSNRPRHLRDSIEFLLEHAPDDLAELACELIQHPQQLRRILLNCEDGILLDLFNVISPPELAASQISQLFEAIVNEGLFQDVPLSTASRTAFWTSVLTTAAAFYSRAVINRATASLDKPTRGDASIRSNFGISVFTQLAKDAPDAYATIINAIIKLRGAGGLTIAGEIKAVLLSAASEVERRYPGNVPKEAAAELARLLWPEEVLLNTYDPSSQITVNGRSLALQNGNPIAARDFLQAPSRPSRRQVPKSEYDARAKVIDLAFGDADSVYIENSGLVILWLFLERFFDRLQLLNGNNFKDAAARHRGAGLLQYIVTEDPSPPEYQMTLNKLMCGIDPEEVLDFGPAVTEAEAEACLNLLSAVVENAPVLRNMSHDGFRGSFLLRKGVVSAGEASWILRVERETFDLVLDRFPWSFSWVKLPWMEIPLGVEW